MKISFAGNSRVIAAIDSCIREKRIPHAIIISGEEGTGRHTLAKYLAKSIICSGDNAPCDKCRDCTLYDSGNHPDIIFVCPEDGKKSITAAKARDIRMQAFVKPHMGGKKVFIIENSETLAPVAQNIMLKTLEEPPENVYFILLTLNSAALLDTIISRCACFELSHPEQAESREYIESLKKYAPADIDAALKTAKSNIGMALRILEGTSKGKTDEIAQSFAELLFKNTGAYELLKTVRPLEKDRKEVQGFISSLKGLLAKKARESANDNYTLSVILKYYEVIEQAEPALITNINLSLFFSALVCALKEI